MLIALLTVFLLGGSSTAVLDYIGDSGDRIEEVLEKDNRQKAALNTLKQMKKRTKARNKDVRGHAKQLTKLLKQSDSTGADFDATWEVHFAQLEEYNADMLDLRYKLKNQLKREEWAQVFPAE